MKCTLMNKNTKIFDFEIDYDYNIINIYDIYNIEYAPYMLLSFSDFIDLIHKTNEWFNKRSIPSWRKQLQSLFEKLNVKSSEELVSKSYGLSLSDQYWFKEYNSDIKWENINFFTNDFEYEAYFDASLGISSNSSSKISLYSPNNTTDGMIQKAWIIDNKKRYLLKGSYGRLNIEPINEWLASEIARRMGFDYCNYEITIYKDLLVSKCECFINECEELIPASQIFNNDKKSNNETDFGYYVRIIKKHGIENAEQKLKEMFLIDYLIGNYDRHLNNFGIIRNVETLKWERTAPIFDSGSSMCSNAKNVEEINLENTVCKFFTNTEMNTNDLYNYLNLNKFDLSPLKGLDLEYKKMLKKYQKYTMIIDEVIDKLSLELSKRINNK